MTTMATTAVEAAEAVAETTVPVMQVGTLDKKKVAIAAVSVAAIGVGTYFCIKAMKKRKANKIVLESTATPVEAEEVPVQ